MSNLNICSFVAIFGGKKPIVLHSFGFDSRHFTVTLTDHTNKNPPPQTSGRSFPETHTKRQQASVMHLFSLPSLIHSIWHWPAFWRDITSNRFEGLTRQVVELRFFNVEYRISPKKSKNMENTVQQFFQLGASVFDCVFLSRLQHSSLARNHTWQQCLFVHFIISHYLLMTALCCAAWWRSVISLPELKSISRTK